MVTGVLQLGSTSHLQLPFKDNLKTPSLQNEINLSISLIYFHMLAQKHKPGLWRWKRLVWLISWDFPWVDVSFD